MHHVLFVRHPKSVASLFDIAARVFSLLHLVETEERDSSNYVDGHYFIACAANASVKVCRSDEATLDDHPYWVVLQDTPSRKDLHGVLNTNPEPSSISELKRSMALRTNGLHVARISDDRSRAVGPRTGNGR